LQALAAKLDTRVSAIEALGPQIFSALTQLKDGLTAAGAGLTKLGSAFRAVEYGSAGVYAGTTQIGVFIGSPDIPDDGNSASAAGSFPSDPTVLAGGTPLVLRATIRSNETDGAATGDPAGQVGGLLYATCDQAGGCGAVALGQIGCATGPPPSQPFTTPVGVLNLHLVNIQQKDSETDPTTPGPSGGVNATGGSCTIPAPAGGTYIIHAQAQFFDLPTSSTPGPTD
jgi:hypothetical protein